MPRFRPICGGCNRGVSFGAKQRDQILWVTDSDDSLICFCGESCLKDSVHAHRPTMSEVLCYDPREKKKLHRKTVIHAFGVYGSFATKDLDMKNMTNEAILDILVKKNLAKMHPQAFKTPYPTYHVASSLWPKRVSRPIINSSSDGDSTEEVCSSMHE